MDPREIAKIIPASPYLPYSIMEQDDEDEFEGPDMDMGPEDDLEPDLGEPEDELGPDMDMDMDMEAPSESIEMDRELLGLLFGYIRDISGTPQAEAKINDLIDAVVEHGVGEEELEGEPTGRIMTGQEDFEEIITKIEQLGGEGDIEGLGDEEFGGEEFGDEDMPDGDVMSPDDMAAGLGSDDLEAGPEDDKGIEGFDVEGGEEEDEGGEEDDGDEEEVEGDDDEDDDDEDDDEDDDDDEEEEYEEEEDDEEDEDDEEEVTESKFRKIGWSQ